MNKLDRVSPVVWLFSLGTLLVALVVLLEILAYLPWWLVVGSSATVAAVISIIIDLSMQLGARPVVEELELTESQHRQTLTSIEVLVNALLCGNNIVILDGVWSLSVDGVPFDTSILGVSYFIPVGSNVRAIRSHVEWNFDPERGYVYVLALDSKVLSILEVLTAVQYHLLLGVAPSNILSAGNGYYLLVLGISKEDEH